MINSGMKERILSRLDSVLRDYTKLMEEYSAANHWRLSLEENGPILADEIRLLIRLQAAIEKYALKDSIYYQRYKESVASRNPDDVLLKEEFAGIVQALKDGYEDGFIESPQDNSPRGLYVVNKEDEKLGYPAIVYKVMIASPSDVKDEREIIREVINDWNIVNSEKRGVVLLPIGWDTHVSPEMGDRPQEIINKSILDSCDILVAVFWARVGSPTGKSKSGTIEEIENHIEKKKLTMVYFSESPISPEKINHEQYEAVKNFRKSITDKGLYSKYSDKSDFKELFYKQLSIKMNDHNRFPGIQDAVRDIPEKEAPLSAEAVELLVAASNDKSGSVHHIRSLGNRLGIVSNQKQFIPDKSHRSLKLWEGAIGELCAKNLLEQTDIRGEHFEITEEGYKAADLLKANNTREEFS